MTAPLALSLLLSAVWSDPSGRVTCSVPDGFAEAGPAHFAEGDTRLVLLPFIPRERVSSAWELTSRMLGSVGLPAPAGADPSAAVTGSGLSASVSVVTAPDGWAGAMVLGLPGDASLQAHAYQIASGCHIAAPAVWQGRLFDPSRRLSVVRPAGSAPFEYKNGGGVRGPGWQIFLVAPVGTATDVFQQAPALAARAGVSPPSIPVPTSAGPYRAAISDGQFQKEGRSFFAAAAAIDVGGTPVGLLLVADESARESGRQAFVYMLSTAATAR